jgi:tetratricopeptide (TPR) repeat protein
MAREKALSGDLEAALAELGKIEGQPEWPEQADAFVLKAQLLLAQDKVDEAVKALESAIALKPKAVGPHFALVSLLLRQGKFEDARVKLGAMQQALGAHPMVAYLRAFMDFRDSKLKEARDGSEQVLKTAPDFLPGQLLAGSIYLRLNEQQRAQASLNKVLERVPNQPLARRLLVASLLASHDNDRAEEELQPLLANSKKDPAVLSLAGQVYLASGDFDRSSEYFEQVAKLAPEDAPSTPRTSGSTRSAQRSRPSAGAACRKRT